MDQIGVYLWLSKVYLQHRGLWWGVVVLYTLVKSVDAVRPPPPPQGVLRTDAVCGDGWNSLRLRAGLHPSQDGRLTDVRVDRPEVGDRQRLRGG